MAPDPDPHGMVPIFDDDGEVELLSLIAFKHVVGE